ncbi:MAG: mechanosensitive ion channel family protein [Mycobacterium sp.]|nr:mechanosensitive ion channel family protein [Mycobacterium sp.]
MSDVLAAPWFYWAVGIAIGLPVLLIALTEWQHTLRRKGSSLIGPVSLLRNYLLPLGALLMAMIGATQMPAGSTPVRIVGTLVATVVLLLMLSGIKASLFASAPETSWRRRMPAIFLDVARFALIAIGIALIFAYIWGANVGGLFTALGIGSIVIGLTLQNSVGQIISGLLMLFEQPFRIGDWIDTPKASGRVIEVNWRAVHLETSQGVLITPNSVLAGAAFTNMSRPVGQYATRVVSVFALEDHPDQVCDMLVRVASGLPQCHPDLTPIAVPIGDLKYRTKIPLRSPGDDGDAEANFRRWIWYAARRAGLHLDEADDAFHDPDAIKSAIRTVVAPTLRLNGQQQEEMAPHATIECYGAGELILATGAVPEAMQFVISGTVLLTADAEDGTRTEIGTLESGAYLGQSMLIRHPVTGSSFAYDEVTLIRVEREAIERVVQKNPLLLQEFGRSIDERRASVVRALAETADPGEPTGTADPYPDI